MIHLKESPKSLVAIQEEYMETVSLGMDRWSHRRDGGHINRIQRGARKTAEKKLKKWGFCDEDVEQIIQQAKDMLALERAAVDDELNYAQ